MDEINTNTLEPIIAALKKQLPAVVITHDPFDDYLEVTVCPNCCSELDSGVKYCCNCGQRLSWTSEDD